jgi:DNA-directed RNA polymerase specialized sigma24 family protein
VDRRQWELELQACYGRVLRGLIAIAGTRDRGEDAFHDALSAALEPGVVEGIERVDAWLFAVGIRKLRKSAWRRRLEAPLGELRLRSAGPSIDRVSGLELLRQLSPRQREVVIARFYLDLSFKEIGAALGITPGTATATLSQALTKLRRNAVETEGTTWTNVKS